MSYQTYSLILCLIIFAMLVSVSVLVISIIYKQKIKLIKSGTEDNEIVADYEKEKDKKENKLSKVLDRGLTLLFGFVFITAFGIAMYINCTQNTQMGNIPVYKVVKTDSMAQKHKKNTYLVEHNLNNQFRSMDLILIHKLPAEKDLKLYDIVVYEVDGILLVHRIVGIEEPNEKHTERYFLLQGDAVEAPDRFPVYYSQMKGLYKGEKIPFVGSFVLFLQSPAGWVSILLVVVTMVVTPILENKLKKQRMLRLESVLGAEIIDSKGKRFKNIKKGHLSYYSAKAFIGHNFAFKNVSDISKIKSIKFKSFKVVKQNLDKLGDKRGAK